MQGALRHGVGVDVVLVLLLPCGFWESNSSLHAWHLSPVPAELGSPANRKLFILIHKCPFYRTGKVCSQVITVNVSDSGT